MVRIARIVGILAWSAVLLPLVLCVRALALVGARRGAMRGAARVQTAWARGLAALIRLEIEREGELPAGPCLIVANHLSYLDVLVLASLFHGRFVAKSEIAGWPLLGFLTRASGTLFVVQRERRDLVRVDAEMRRTLGAGVPVLLFPEGHSTRGLGIDRLHSSLLACAASGAVPCLALALGYETPDDPWAPASTVCWWGGMDFPRHAWRLLGLRRVRARVRAAAHVRSAGDRKLLAEALHADLVERFVPVRQEPIAPDCPWPGMFAAESAGGAARSSTARH